MIGAIIGDLAAWTWENDHEKFYPSLISEKALLSEFGLSVLATADALDFNLFMNEAEYQEYIRPWFRVVNDDVVCYSEGVKEWIEKQDYNYNYNTMAIGIAMVRVISCAWYQEKSQNNCSLIFEHDLEKEAWYSLQFLRKIIYLLRNSKTKDDVYAELGGIFKGCRHDWDWRNQESPISYILRAWDAFYNAFDFGSALHNAMRMKGNKRLLGTLTGAIAEAMYGCRNYFIKKKYADENHCVNDIRIPLKVNERYHRTISKIKRQKEWARVFWAKNDARTNIEYHHFTHITNPFKEKVISPELHRRVIKSFEPGWEDRYSFYLDNGWIYVCRSFVLLGRFRFRKLEDGTYRIFDIQESDENGSSVTGIEEALYSVEHNWLYLESPYKYLIQYYSEVNTEMPKEYKGTHKADFWHGEMMLHEDGDNIGQWIEAGMDTLERQNDIRLYKFAKELGKERFGVAYYINELYAKWCPYDNLDWIFEY